MPTNVIMPALELAQETGKVLRWMKAPGDTVRKGEPLVEIETDKVTVEIEAPASGVLSAVTAQEGDVVPVGQTIALIAAAGEAPPSPPSTLSPPGRGQGEGPRGEGPVRASPLARKIAEEHGVDIARIKTASGKIEKADVLAFVESRKTAANGGAGRLVAASPKARRLAAERPVDVIDAHYAYPDGHAARLLARDLGVPYVLSLRGSDAYVLSRFPARRWRIEQALAAATRVVTVSTALAHAAQGLGAAPERIRVIPNGVDTHRFRPLDRAQARGTLGVPDGTRLLLSVGRLAEVKGFDLLLRGMARLARHSEVPVRCAILGEGPARGRLVDLARTLGLEGRLDLPGWVKSEDLPTWYAAADLFVLLSESEGWPNVVVEALACGAPVIGSRVGGIPEMISDGVNGFLLPERSVEATAELLALGIEQSWNREAIAHSPVVRDWTETAKAQLEVLHEAAGGS